MSDDEVALALKRVTVARVELEDAERSLLEARRAMCPFKEGDVVEAKAPGDYDWKPAIVREVTPMSYRPWYRVSFRKKDGKWSSVERQAFSEVRAADSEQTS